MIKYQIVGVAFDQISNNKSTVSVFSSFLKSNIQQNYIHIDCVLNIQPHGSLPDDDSICDSCTFSRVDEIIVSFKKKNIQPAKKASVKFTNRQKWCKTWNIPHQYLQVDSSFSSLLLYFLFVKLNIIYDEKKGKFQISWN